MIWRGRHATAKGEGRAGWAVFPAHRDARRWWAWVHAHSTRLFADDGAVVMTRLWSATHQGDIPSFPATGRKITMSGATVYFFEGDKLAAYWQITDRLGVYHQLQSAKADA
nr:ester cyclase [Methylomagnum ishizawai]